MVVHRRAAGQHVCVCANMDQWRPPTWASRFLHSWVCCWCCCRAALACLSRLLTSRWCSWTRLSFSALCCCCSRVLSCSCCMRCSAIWLDKQAKRDFISQHTLRATLSSWQLVHPPIHSTFLRPIPSTPSLHLEHPCAQPRLAKLVRRRGKKKKKREKFLRFVTLSEDDMMCLHLACSPTLPPLLPIIQTGPQCPTPLSPQICPPCPFLRSAYKRAVSLGYACKLVGVSHLAAVTTQCPMLCAWQHVKIGLGVDYDDHYKPKSETKTVDGGEDSRNFEKTMNGLTNFKPIQLFLY